MNKAHNMKTTKDPQRPAAAPLLALLPEAEASAFAPLLALPSGRRACELLGRFETLARSGNVPPALVARWLAPLSRALLFELRGRARASGLAVPEIGPSFDLPAFGALERFLGALVPSWAVLARRELERFAADYRGRMGRPGWTARPLQRGDLLLFEPGLVLLSGFESLRAKPEARLLPAEVLREAYGCSQRIGPEDSASKVAAALVVALCYGERASLSQVLGLSPDAVKLRSLVGEVWLPATQRALGRTAELRGASLDVLRRFLELRPSWRASRPEGNLLRMPQAEAGYQALLALLRAELVGPAALLARSPRDLASLSLVASVLERFGQGGDLREAQRAELATGRAGSRRPEILRQRFERGLPGFLELAEPGPARAAG